MLTWVEPYCYIIVMASGTLMGTFSIWVTFKPPKDTAHLRWLGVFAVLIACQVFASLIDHRSGEREKAESMRFQVALQKSVDTNAQLEQQLLEQNRNIDAHLVQQRLRIDAIYAKVVSPTPPAW